MLGLIDPYLQAADGVAVHDPATGQLIARVADFSEGEIEQAITEAQGAFPAWAARPARERARLLQDWFRAIMDHQEDLATLMTAESGKPMAESRGEVAYAAAFVEWFAEQAKRVEGDMIASHLARARILVLKQPVGVAAAITPWNFPAAMITRKAAPALAAGCPILVKPAEATPLTALGLQALATQAGLPPALFRIVTMSDPDRAGQMFCGDPRIRKFSFTGSTRVGKMLAARCAGTVKRVSLELGGNAPFIVFADADLEAAVEGAVASKFRNAGQTCVCANRFLVDARIHDAFVEKLRARMVEFVVGPGSEPGVTIGPLINAGAVEKVDRLVQASLSAGARLVIGGDRHQAGPHFYQPTLLTGVTQDMAVAKEEIFGPVAPVLTFQNEEEAIAMANDTPSGLAGYFYSRDLGRVMRVMEALEVGMVGINEGILSTEVAPFGGVKESGLGREGSRYGIDEYLETKYALLGGLNQ